MSLPGSAEPSALHDLRRARRAFVAAQHPDRGGDPTAFAAGLAHFALLLDRADHLQPGALPRVVVLRRPTGVLGWLRHLTRLATRRDRPRRSRLS